MSPVAVSKAHRPDPIADVLERLYARYNHRSFVGSDPLQFAYRYSDSRDIEIAAFLAAALAYGRVQQIHKSLDDLFARLGPSPHAFVKGLSQARRNKLADFKHRFTTGRDVTDLLILLQAILRRHGSIEAFFSQGYDPAEPNILSALTRFCDSLTQRYARKHDGRVSRGLMYLLASPSRGSASKRLHLFLRWMIRDDEVDLGLWKSINKAKLIVPMDTHMARLCRILGFHDSQTISRATATTVTECFARIKPEDPVKYDFALSRVGIVESCTGRARPECPACELFCFCGDSDPRFSLSGPLSAFLMRKP